MPSYMLNIPTYKTPVGARRLWRYYGTDTSRTLIKTEGTWRVVTTPTTEALNTAEGYYRGGYVNIVTQEVADDLTADGFGSYLVVIPGS